MAYFTQYDSFHIEFMVACMQFVNIVVHSVEDMNFRVHLQYEFTKLGLDEYLEKLRHTESEDLQVNKLNILCYKIKRCSLIGIINEYIYFKSCIFIRLISINFTKNKKKVKRQIYYDSFLFII